MTELEHPKRENPFQGIDPDLAGEGTVVVQWIGEKGCGAMVAELGGILTPRTFQKSAQWNFWKIYPLQCQECCSQKGISKQALHYKTA